MGKIGGRRLRDGRFWSLRSELAFLSGVAADSQFSQASKVSQELIVAIKVAN